MLVQKLQPYFDLILSFEKKKTKPSKQASPNNHRKTSLGGPPFRKQAVPSPHIRPTRPLAPKAKKPRKAKQTLPPPARVPALQRGNQSFPVQPQPEPTKSAPAFPPPAQTAMPYTDSTEPPSFAREEIPIFPSAPLEDCVQTEPGDADLFQIEDTPLVSSDALGGPVQSSLKNHYPDPLQPVIPQTKATLKHKPVIYPKIPYTEQQNGTYVLVSLLEEIWDVDWEHPVSIKWGQKWSVLRYEIDVKVKEIRHNQSGSILWVSGEFLLTRIGTSANDLKLLHETLTIPFATTILHPSLEKSDAKILRPDDLPPYHEKLWTETGDWKVMLIANPLKMEPSETGEYDGFIQVTGKIWWFRKQLLPFNGGKQYDQLSN
jgi:hypothetical protein